MKIVLNYTNFLTKIPEKDTSNLIISQFKGDEFRHNTKYMYLPWGYNSATTFNNAFWILKLNIQNNKNLENLKIYKNIKEIIIVNIYDEIKQYIKDNKIELKKNKVDKKYDIEIIETKSKIQHFYIKINNIEILNIPVISYFDKDINKPYFQFLLGWLFEISQKYKTNFQINEEKAYSFFEENKLKQIINKKREILYNKYQNIINAGNEGFLLLEDKKINKYTKKEIIENPIFKNFEIDIKNIINLNKEINMTYKEHAEYHIFEYDNIIFPTTNLNFPDSAYSLIQQNKNEVIINDNKLMNFGKIHKIGPIFKVIFNDFGRAFIKHKKNDKDEFKEKFDGIIRDNFFLVKEYKNRNCREIIKDMREYPIDKLKNENETFQKFFDFIKNYEEEEVIYACHTKDFVKKVIDKKIQEVYVCELNVNTMKIKRSTANNKHYIYELYTNFVGECKPKDFNEKEFKFFKLQNTDEYKEELNEQLYKVKESTKYKVIYE